MASIANVVGLATDDDDGAGILSTGYCSRRDVGSKCDGATTGRNGRTELAAVG